MDCILELAKLFELNKQTFDNVGVLHWMPFLEKLFEELFPLHDVRAGCYLVRELLF